MRRLIDEYAQAVAARACAMQVSIGAMSPGHKTPLLIAAEAREAKAREALDDAVRGAADLVAQSIPEVEAIAVAAPQMYADDPRIAEGYRANFERPHNATRAFTLKDARPLARHSARMLRQAWELLDPSLPSPFTRES
jgi:hypothetical protein